MKTQRARAVVAAALCLAAIVFIAGRPASPAVSLASSSPPSIAPLTDCEHFVADLTIPDGTTVSPGATLNKGWRLHNCGTSDWSGLTAVRIGGGFGPSSFGVPATAPGSNADIYVNFTAPAAPGHYRSTYQMQGPRGALVDSFWIDIYVVARVTDCERFVADLTIPDGARVSRGASLNKGWRLHNCGTSTWAGFNAVRVSGSFGPVSFPVPYTPPGANGDLWAVFPAPTTPGRSTATYKLVGPRGALAGTFWVTVVVNAAPPPLPGGPPPKPSVYVALGDSYSSGEGNPPFLDTSSVTARPPRMVQWWRPRMGAYLPPSSSRAVAL